MRVLVTGASGSPGRAVLGRLRDDRISVRGVRTWADHLADTYGGTGRK
ncbi:hypothetical protein OHB44_01085 [Micromonospora sp. NBC_00821]|nr:hypothetical protein OHB44_01085 [Micromonospora sp. NBC_00821]